MAQVAIKVKNLDKLTKLATKYPRIAQKHIDNAIVMAIGNVDIETKPITPVDTARLRNSMVPIFSPFKGVYGTKVNYASRVHDMYEPGTPYRNPSKNKQAVAGFLEIGVKRARPDIDKAFSDALEKIVAELAS